MNTRKDLRTAEAEWTRTDHRARAHRRAPKPKRPWWAFWRK